MRIRHAVRDSDAVARLGGDEFGILLTEVANEADIVTVIDRITGALEEPIVVQEMSLAVEASIGVVIYPEHGSDMEMLSQNADVAMYAAKLQNLPHACYDPVEDRRDPPQHTLMAELHQAIANRELELFYQPIAALATGEVESVEALLRWNHPTRG